jgi:hypothetical protein
MHPPSSSVGSIRYGVDAERLALRFGDEAPRFRRAEVDLWVGEAAPDVPPAARVVVERDDAGGYSARVGDGSPQEVARAPALELAVPLAALGASAGDRVQLRIVLDEEGRGRETVPPSGALTVLVPDSGLSRGTPVT